MSRCRMPAGGPPRGRCTAAPGSPRSAGRVMRPPAASSSSRLRPSSNSMTRNAAPAARDAEVHHGHRVRVFDAAGRYAFPLEAGQGLRRAGGGGLEHLDRHQVLQAEVQRAVDRAEGAGPDRGVQAVLAGQDFARAQVRGARAVVHGRDLRPVPELGLDAGHHHREVQRLGHVVVGSRLQRLDHVAAVVARGGHDHRQLGRGPGLPHGPEDLHPGHAGHLDVQEHEVHGLPGDGVQGVGPAVRREDAIPLLLQAAAQHVAVHFIVVHDQQRGLGGGRIAHGGSSVTAAR